MFYSQCNQRILDLIMPHTIQVDKGLLAQLLRDSYKLNCLEAAGVDNWENYSEALSGKELDGENYWDLKSKSDSEIIKEYGFKE